MFLKLASLMLILTPFLGVQGLITPQILGTMATVSVYNDWVGQ
jgi:hypothetical protein